MSHADASSAPAFSRVPDAPRSDDPSALGALAADLADAPFTHEAVQAILSPLAMAALSREQAVPALRELRARALAGTAEPLDALIELFLLGRPVASEALDAALPRTGTETMLRLGLVALEDDAAGRRVRAAVDLRPHASDADAELWVASDLGQMVTQGVLRRDHVLGIGGASLTLAGFTLRAPVARALDLGVGCGIQTFHLLAHADHVTATDLSERALAFTRFNLLLNHAALRIDPQALEERVSLRQGSLLEPVEGERFDLVVSNPPFVITPRRARDEAERFTYRDGGLPGDQLVAQLWTALPGVLNRGGQAQLLANWEIPTGDDADGEGASGGPQEEPHGLPRWARRLDAWTPEGVEAWVIQRDVEDPAGYAETWLRDAAEITSREHAEARYEEYLEDFASRAVEGIGFGMVWMRVGAATPGVGRRYEEILRQVDQPTAPWIAASIERADVLAAARERGTEGELFLSVAEDVTQEAHSRPGDEHPQVLLVRQGAGARRSALLSTAEAGVVSACDGELAVGRLVNAVCSLLDAQSPGSAPDPAGLLAAVLDLSERGFLLPHLLPRGVDA